MRGAAVQGWWCLWVQMQHWPFSIAAKLQEVLPRVAPKPKGLLLLVLLTGRLPVTLLWSGQGTGPSVCITAHSQTTQRGGSTHATRWGSFEVCWQGLGYKKSKRQSCARITYETLKGTHRVLIFRLMKNVFKSFVIVLFTFYYPLPTTAFLFI